MINKKNLKLKNINRLKVFAYSDTSSIKSLTKIKKAAIHESRVHKKSHESILFFNVCFDKTILKLLVTWFLDKYGEKITVDLVETLKQIGFHQATCAGVSLGIDDLKIPQKKAALVSQASVQMTNASYALQAGNLTSVEKSQRLIDTWNQTSEVLRETAVINFITKNPLNPVYMMAFSGARGNMSQVRQLVAMRGLMADPQGAILEFPIQSNFREGLTVTEYLISCYGARKGLVDTALRTATSGYLTRRLVVAVQHVVIHVINCKTTKGLILRQKNLQQKLIGRVLLKDTVLNSQKIIKKNTVISPFLAKQLAVQYEEIHVRSPLTCQTLKSVCQLCFGLDLAKGKLVSLGEAVGVIAAQSIGEPGTQLTMRTFHTGGVGVFSDQAMKSFIAPFSGKVHFSESLSGIFVRTPHGNSVYLLKHKIVEKNKTLLKLTGPTDKLNLSLKPICYEIKYQDVSSGSLLWVKQGQFVKRGQVLLQVSRLEASKQEMPESSHPVLAPFSGEIFFQYIKTQCIEEKIKKPKKKKSKQKEIVPTFLTLTELGTFWLFSCFIQKQNKIYTQFFVMGDLISPKTPTQQYNLQVPYKGQLKIFNSEIILAQNSIEFLFSKIIYSKGLYFIHEKQNLLVYKENSTLTRLAYYPTKRFYGLEKMQGFYKALNFEKNVFKQKPIEKNNVFFLDHEKKNQNIKRVTIYLVSLHQVWCLKRSLNFLQTTLSQKININRVFSNYSFVITYQKKNLSKSGFFLLKYVQHKIWSKKNIFEKKLVANYQAHFLKLKQNYSLSFLESKIRERKTKGHSIFSYFLKKALKKNNLQHHTLLIKKNQTWIYISNISTSSLLSSQLSGVLLEPGKAFDNLFFPHCYISINVLNKTNISFLQGNLKQSFLFYSLKDIKVKTNQSKKKTNPLFFNSFSRKEKRNNFSKKVLKSQKKKKGQNKYNWSNTNQKNLYNFCFYKKQNLQKEKKKKSNIVYNFTKLHFQLLKKQRLFYFICLEKKFIDFFPTKKFIYKTWYQSLCNKNPVLSSTFKSPLFSKQVKTSFNQYKILKPKIEVGIPLSSGWFSPATFLKFYIDFQIFKTFGKVEDFQQKIVLEEKSNNNREEKVSYDGFFPGLSIAFYRKILLDNPYTFCFQTFENDSVLPHFSITKAFYKAKNLGEFRRIQNKQKKFYSSLLRNQDFVTFILPNNLYSLDKKSLPKIGSRIRWSQELVPNFASSLSGQIIKFRPNRITLRKGLPFLASIRGLLHINENDLILKKDLLMTLRSRRLETEDIVQGIPKIEQLFEARETHGGKIIENSMHKLLNHFFNLTCRVRPLSEAVEYSLTYIQKFLIKNIVEAYSNQGVYIAEKHVEVVVRQMTARVRIIHGGQSDLIPGELVQLRHIEKVNSRLAIRKYRQATYEPIILGITKSALQSESFLLAASFQQVSKVLVKSALSKKTDFLQGLHENVLVGQQIPAGTGIIDILKFYKPTNLVVNQ